MPLQSFRTLFCNKTSPCEQATRLFWQTMNQKWCTYSFVWMKWDSFPAILHVLKYVVAYVKYKKILFPRASQLMFLKHIFTRGCMEEIKTQQCLFFLLSLVKYYFEQAIKDKLSTWYFVFFFKLSSNCLIAFRKRIPARITYCTEVILNIQYLFEMYRNT